MRSASWPAFCRILPSVLSDADAEVADGAITFAESVYEEVRNISAQQLAELCMAMAAHFAASNNRRHQSEPPAAAASEGDAARRRVARLLLRCLQVLPRMWATFKPDLMQRLWDALCPVLRLSRSLDTGPCAIAANSAPCWNCESSASRPDQAEHGHAAARGWPEVFLADAERQHGLDASRAGQAHCAGSMPGAGCDSGDAEIARGEKEEGHVQRVGRLQGCLVELCELPEWDASWWRAWTAPAMAARVSSRDDLPDN